MNIWEKLERAFTPKNAVRYFAIMFLLALILPPVLLRIGFLPSLEDPAIRVFSSTICADAAELLSQDYVLSCDEMKLIGFGRKGKRGENRSGYFRYENSVSDSKNIIIRWSGRDDKFAVSSVELSDTDTILYSIEE